MNSQPPPLASPYATVHAPKITLRRTWKTFLWTVLVALPGVGLMCMVGFVVWFTMRFELIGTILNFVGFVLFHSALVVIDFYAAWRVWKDGK